MKEETQIKLLNALALLLILGLIIDIIIISFAGILIQTSFAYTGLILMRISYYLGIVLCITSFFTLIYSGVSILVEKMAKKEMRECRRRIK